MTKPVTIPNTFATATTAIPLSNLDADFSTVATALNDANTYSNYAPDTGSANAYVVTLSGVSTTYSAGLRIQFKAGNANTTASTLNVNGGGAKNITYQDATAIASGTIAANSIVDVMYDGTQFLLMNDPAGATGGDVVGPSSATDNAIVRFDGTTGKLVQNSVVTIADSTGDISGVGQLNATTVDATNIEVTNIKAKDGTAAASIADSTGVISITSNPVLSGGTANGVLYLNGSKVATSGSALVFDGTNLGLGVTPSAWATYKPLQIGQNAISGTGTDLELTSNAYYNAGWKYATTSGGATRYSQQENAYGTHAWYIAASGTAGNAITWTQAMTLDASGQLGIGTTSPTAQLGIYSNNVHIQLQNATTGSAASDGSRIYLNGSDLLLVNRESATMQFYTADTERARITSGGYFKASNSGTYLDSTGSFHELASDDSDDAVAVLKLTNASYTGPGAFVDISRNTTNNTFYAISYFNRGASAYKFRVADSGDVTNTNGTYGTISDAKMKTDIVDAGSQWADIKAIRFRKFKMKNDPSELVQLGVVAQELEQTSPGLVDEHVDRDAEGNDLGTTTKSVKTSILLMKAAKALQEAMARIETLEAKVSALEGN